MLTKCLPVFPQFLRSGFKLDRDRVCLSYFHCGENKYQFNTGGSIELITLSHEVGGLMPKFGTTIRSDCTIIHRNILELHNTKSHCPWRENIFKRGGWKKRAFKKGKGALNG